MLIARPPAYPGVAQFGSALEWGSRGREFDSRHSDQIAGLEESAENRLNFGVRRFFLCFDLHLFVSVCLQKVMQTGIYDAKVMPFSAKTEKVVPKFLARS